MLSQEEFLAAVLAEHWGKLAMGVGLAVAVRLPVHVLNNDSILCHMLINLAVMLRCMSLVMLLIRDDVALPKREKLQTPTASLPPPPPSPPPQTETVPQAPGASTAAPASPRRRPSAAHHSPSSAVGAAAGGSGG